MAKKTGIFDIIKEWIDREGIPENKSDLARQIISLHPEKFSSDQKKALNTCRGYVHQVVRQLARKNTFGDVLKENSFDRGNWSHGWLKVKGASIFIKNPEMKRRLEELVDSAIERMKDHAPDYPEFTKPQKGSRMLVIDPADVHIGKLSVTEETGFEYNREIAVKRLREGINGLLSEVNKKSIGQICLIIGNDILHVDTPKGATTKGTLLDKDGQWWQMIDVAMEIYVEIIEQLMRIAPVRVIHCPSNHDFVNGYTLAKMVKAHFRKTSRVSFDVSIKQRKYLVYGVNLLGFSHGDGAKHSDLQHLMTVEAKKHISSTSYRYFMIHHGHHKDRKKYKGEGVSAEKDLTAVTVIETDYTPPEETVTVEMVRTPSPPDGWHSRNGYVNQQSLEAFVFCAYSGQKTRHSHNF